VPNSKWYAFDELTFSSILIFLLCLRFPYRFILDVVKAKEKKELGLQPKKSDQPKLQHPRPILEHEEGYPPNQKLRFIINENYPENW
jgi:hypothetical protein